MARAVKKRKTARGRGVATKADQPPPAFTPPNQPATEEDRKKWKGWCEIESDPVRPLFNRFFVQTAFPFRYSKAGHVCWNTPLLALSFFVQSMPCANRSYIRPSSTTSSHNGASAVLVYAKYTPLNRSLLNIFPSPSTASSFSFAITTKTPLKLMTTHLRPQMYGSRGNA